MSVFSYIYMDGIVKLTSFKNHVKM